MGSRHTHAPSHWVLNNDYYISTWLLSTHGSDDIHLWTLPIFLISTTPPVKFYDCILKVAVLSCLQNLSAGRHTDMMHSPQMFSKLLGCDKCLSVYLQVSIPGDIDFTGNIYIYISMCARWLYPAHDAAVLTKICQNHICGCSRCKRCHQLHMLPWWHTHTADAVAAGN